MPDTSGPYDGAPWAEADWYRSMAPTLASGVHGTTPATSATAGSLAWAATGLTITPAAGRASVGGSGYVRTATLTSVTASTNTHASFSRRDRLVLRRSLATHTVTLAIVTGTPASSPVAPAVTRDDTTWDLPLFSFLVPPASGTTISGVSDERAWIDPYRRTRQMVLESARVALTGTHAPGAEVIVTDTDNDYEWNGSAWVCTRWDASWGLDLNSTTYNYAVTATPNTNIPGGTGGPITIPPGRTLDVEFTVSQVNVSGTGTAWVQLWSDSTLLDGAMITVAGTNIPLKMTGSLKNTTGAPITANVSVAAWVMAGAVTFFAGSGGAVRLRHRIT